MFLQESKPIATIELLQWTQQEGTFPWKQAGAAEQKSPAKSLLEWVVQVQLSASLNEEAHSWGWSEEGDSAQG